MEHYPYRDSSGLVCHSVFVTAGERCNEASRLAETIMKEQAKFNEISISVF